MDNGQTTKDEQQVSSPPPRPLHVAAPFPACSLPACDVTHHRLQLGDLSAELEKKYSKVHPDLCSIKDAVHVPDIIHSTVMRVASQPSNAGRLAEGLADLSARWEPATVKVGEITLVYENHPYMHFSREGAEEVLCYRLPVG